jgi:hypothetical protein
MSNRHQAGPPAARLVLRTLTIIGLAAGAVACGRQDERAASLTAATDTLPLPDARLIELAAQAEARLDPASTVRSGPRVCVGTDSTDSPLCELELTVRTDVGDFGPDRVQGGFAVLAVIRNLGDSAEASTSIPARTTAYVLVQQGGAQRTGAWYFSIDQAQRRAVAIRRLEYVACPQPHEDPAATSAAWRRCPAPTDAPRLEVQGGDPPPWFTCTLGCCELDS